MGLRQVAEVYDQFLEAFEGIKEYETPVLFTGGFSPAKESILARFR